MLTFLKRSAYVAGLFLCGLMALSMVVYMGWQARNILLVNPRYASEVFAPHFPNAPTLESRRHHGLMADWIDCTYAIVELPQDAPAAPPDSASSSKNRAWHLQYGGPQWQPTPMPAQSERAALTFDACLSYWSRDTAGQVRAAISAKGSFVLTPGIGETVFLYSKPQGIAARIRYGD